jgi:DNA (cytosine-5)-methyltransferase 1
MAEPEERRPRLLDLYCGAGMASDGYAQAGFECVGVDIEPQPDYPYPFYEADALSVLNDPVLTVWLSCFDLIHASPPCQTHTRAGHLARAQGNKVGRHRDDLAKALDLLAKQAVPWVVENVPGAPFEEHHTVTLCGSMFGLKVRRHRVFATSFPILLPVQCDHQTQGRPVGVYHVLGDDIPHGGRTARTVEEGWEAMGVDRPIPWRSLTQGFPPVYTRLLGELFLANRVKVG